MRTRLNTGRPNGQYLGQIEGGWTLYNVGDGRFKICSLEPIAGKANYTFGVANQAIDPHAGLDAVKLRKDHEDVYEAVNTFLRGFEKVDGPSSDENDTYGDIALSRRRKLSPWQLYHRAILAMRRIELEHVAARKTSHWDSAIRMLWAGIFKTKITEHEVNRQLAYITKHADKVNLELLLAAEQQFYQQKYAPNSCATLAAQLDTIAGEQEDIDIFT